MKTYGYVRVSTRDQNLDRQLQAMSDYGIPAKQIYQDKLSGKNFDRPAYQKLMKRVRPGDTLVIKSIDRLGRDYREIQEQLLILRREKQALIVVLDFPMLNTLKELGLTGLVISDIMIQLFSYMAETERMMILQRQKEGIAAAKARGVRFGAKPKEKPENFECIYTQWKNNNISARKASKLLGVSFQTFQKWTKTGPC